jgi:hypothetical protein
LRLIVVRMRTVSESGGANDGVRAKAKKRWCDRRKPTVTNRDWQIGKL